MLFITDEPPKLPPLIQYVIEQKIEPKQITWKDNPNKCTDSQWIAKEAPYYCINHYTPPKAVNTVKRAVRGSGNTYSYGYCTWLVKNELSWVPNGLGNANTWDDRASSYGLGVYSTPIVGAVGQTDGGGLGHVVVVTAVGRGTVSIKEMNYRGWNIVSYRTVPTSTFKYIY